MVCHPGLGVNCVELQPLQEFDNEKPADYHWGYMTNNFFSPESSYTVAPAEASGVRELQALVAAFHRRGMAVLLDVVYNHVGVPAHLMFLDRLSLFRAGRGRPRQQLERLRQRPAGAHGPRLPTALLRAAKGPLQTRDQNAQQVSQLSDYGLGNGGLGISSTTKFGPGPSTSRAQKFELAHKVRPLPSRTGH